MRKSWKEWARGAQKLDVESHGAGGPRAPHAQRLTEMDVAHAAGAAAVLEKSVADGAPNVGSHTAVASPQAGCAYPAVRRTVRVGLLWHSVNQGNLGVGALTAGNIIIVEEAAKRLGVAVEFVVIGWHHNLGSTYIKKANLEVVRLRGRDFRPGGTLSRVVAGCDMVLDIGAGDSFSDIYGWKRFAYLCASKWLVLRARRPLILSPQTLGPFRARGAHWAAARLLGRADAVFARDRRSIEALQAAGFDGPIQQATDVAFRLPYDLPERRATAADLPRVGLNLSALLFHGHSRFGMKCDFQALAHAMLKRFTATQACHVVLVAHVLSADAKEDDFRLAQSLAEQYPTVTLAPRFRDPSEAKSFIAGLDFFAGARMHACIAAFSAGVPVAPLAYSRKFAGLFGALDYDAVVDCTQLNAGAACEAVLAAFERRRLLAAVIAQGNRAAQRKLDVYASAVEHVLAAACREVKATA